MKTKANKPAKSNIAKMAIVGVLSAIAYLLMFMEFSVPLMPVFSWSGRWYYHRTDQKSASSDCHIYRWSRRTVKFYSECSIYPAGRIII